MTNPILFTLLLTFLDRVSESSRNFTTHRTEWQEKICSQLKEDITCV